MAASCGVNDKDLATATNAYYSGTISPGQAYELLSKASQDQLSEREFADSRAKYSAPERVAVLSEGSEASNTYAKVVLISFDKQLNCRRRETRTWLQENGRWRVLQFPTLSERAAAQYNAGDYTSALRTTEEWLKLDPFSIDALSMYLISQGRSGSMSSRETRSSSDAIRAMLATNPADDTALFNAATYSDAIGVAKGFFNKIPLDSCVRQDAAFNVLSKLSTAKDKLDFLDEIKLSSPSLSAARIEVLNDLGRGPEALAALKESGESISGHLRGAGDPAWSAGWAVRLGLVAVANSDEVEARRWLETAASLDPQNASLTRLDRRLNDPCCNRLAARFKPARVVGTFYGGSYVFTSLENLSPVAFTFYQAKATVLSKDGSPFAESIEYSSIELVPGQSREIKFVFFSVPREKIASTKIELTIVSVQGLNRGPASFWVRNGVVPESPDEAKAPK